MGSWPGSESGIPDSDGSWKPRELPEEEGDSMGWRPRKRMTTRGWKRVCLWSSPSDEFSRHIVWGNTFKLYNHNVRRLRKIIRSTTTFDHYYVCHMTETFATDGKRMHFSVPFSTGSLFPHMDADRGELPITTRDGTTAVTARFIKGVHKRATITKGWSNFFRQAHMNKGQAYAFAFKCTSKGLRLIVYSI